MKFEGAAIQYLLSREFGDVTSEGLSRGATFDYPMLYDVSADMGGHIVLVPAHERPANDQPMEGTLCICVDGKSARSARKAGGAVVLIHDDVVFQHLYNRMQSVFVKNERLDAQLRALVDAYAGFQPLLDACTNELGFPFALIDEQYRIVCSSRVDAGEGRRELGDASVADVLESESIDLFMASREYRYMRASRSVFTVPGSGNLMMKNIFSEDQLVGSLVIEHGMDALSVRYSRFLLVYLSAFVEEAYKRIGSFGVSSVGVGQVKAALQGALSGSAIGYANLEAALAESGHRPDCSYVVLRIERSFTHEGAEERDFLTRRLELAWPYGYCFICDDELFMLIDTSEGGTGGKGEQKSFAQELPIVARENLAKVGISRTFNEMRHLDAALAQARIALERGSKVDPTNWCYRFKDFAFSWLVANATAGIPSEYVAHPAVTTLMRYDEVHKTDLLDTLATFMRYRYNATSASQALFVARSTLLHRLARIEELTGFDFEDPVDRTYLAFSLSMFE